MVASRYGHSNIVQLLLEHGANANLQNKVSSSAKIVYEAEVNSKVHRFCPLLVMVNTLKLVVWLCVMCGLTVIKYVIFHVCLSLSAWH